MNLLFDIGNTNAVVAVKVNGVFNTWRIGTKSFETEDELFSLIYNLLIFAKIDFNSIDSIGVASVVPNVDFVIKKFVEKYFGKKVYFLSAEVEVDNIKTSADNPKQVGADRYANVIAAKREYGDNVISIDFGTAITVDVLKGGNFVGGAIIPGFNTSMNALFSSAAKLPKIDMNIPDYNMGTNTVDNLQIGIIKTTIYGIERLVEKIKEDTKTDFKIVCTGGAVKSILDNSYLFESYDPDLTLKGIEIFLEKSKM